MSRKKKRVVKKNYCCTVWSKTIDSIKVVDRYEANHHYATALEAVIKHTIGSYCPACGTNLK